MKQLKSFTKVIWNIKDIYKNFFLFNRKKPPKLLLPFSHIWHYKKLLGVLCQYKARMQMQPEQNAYSLGWNRNI